MQQGLDIQDLLNQRKSAYSLAVDQQEIEFADLSRLTTSVGYAFKACGASDQALATLQSVSRRVKGQRTVKPKAAGTAPADAGATPDATAQATTVSTTQMSYANRIDNFALLIETLRPEACYRPNEIHLNLAALEAKLDNMRQCHRTVSAALAALQEVRDERNRLFFHPLKGIIVNVKAVKAYVKSVYGAGSGQYKHIAGLSFTQRS
ncbi:hypothetical protein [Taibaiella helva]|uniref:hypothetical protein n=1 Tax=Taibaiella helva TaxID=2301235 RepID=UPI000E58FF28|nr:hypothetical protein [Taibaiella helva]